MEQTSRLEGKLAGNKTLIKSVVQAISSYVMSIVKLPKSFCAILSSMVAKFWWSQPKSFCATLSSMVAKFWWSQGKKERNPLGGLGGVGEE
ncbi:uncharacterized protein G2W53_022244 [Senna tora]|uniref:Uncharacterized protein n=1 Tax=Senna tora TaxID=362788 RepID=A0A834TLL8_9FABA|nr:uncharacterized protein G2W53_022244 [Senna tora]